MINQDTNLQTLQKRFDQLKSPDNTIKGNLALSTLKPFFKSMPDTDFQTLFTSYISQFSLNDPLRTLSIQQLKHIYLRIQDQYIKIKQHHPYAQFVQQSLVVLRKSKVSYVVGMPVSYSKQQPLFQIFQKELTEIVPYQIIFFDSLYKREDKANVKMQERLTEQMQQQSYVCYDFKVYQSLLENYEGPQMNNQVRFFYKVIDFRWIQALQLLKSQLLNDQKLQKQSPYLLPIFQNLSYIQQTVNKNPQILKPIFQRRPHLPYPNLQSIKPQLLMKINQIRNILDFICSYAWNIYPQFKNWYFRACCYFLGKKLYQNKDKNKKQKKEKEKEIKNKEKQDDIMKQVDLQNQKSDQKQNIKQYQKYEKYQQICNNENLGVMIKFLFARRFLAPELFQQYYKNFLIQTKQNPKLQHIMFFRNKADVVQTLSNYWDNHPAQLQKVALTCGIVIHKLGKGFNKQYPFLQQMVKIYQQLLRTLKQKQIHKQYMIKMMTVRSAKQPIWEDLIVKPQFRLNCQPRNDDCVFLSMLEKFLYGGEQKWNKLKNKSSVASDPSKKHYEVQAKHCPYCNYPTPRCSICLEQIKIFTVKSYLNQQIKRKGQKQQKPYMKLNQPFEQALIWCPNCSHGGHFGHLESWFKMNKACPVDRCQCKCKF